MTPSVAALCTVGIWTFIFHKISGFERVILKVNFNPIYRQKLSIFLSENSDLFYSFFFYFLQNLSNPLLFTHCCCYSKELTYLNCDLMHNTVLASQSVKWFCLGRKSKIPIFKSPYRCFTIIQTSVQIRDLY